MPSEKALAVLADLTARLREAFPGEVAEVVLFGSQLTGKATEYSDYDFVLVWKGGRVYWQKKWAVYAVCNEVNLAHDVLIQPLLISEEELGGLRGAQPVYQDALQYGARAA